MTNSFYTNILGLLLIGICIFGIYKYTVNERDEYAYMHLAEVVDNASEAATLTLLDSRQLNVDYEDYTYVSADPKLAFDTFIEVFLSSYDMSRSAENVALIKKNYLPTFVVALSDGYYIATRQKVKTNSEKVYEDVELTFGPKLPYTYTGANGVKYGLMIGGNYYYKIDGATNVRMKGTPPGLDKNQVSGIINKTISAHMKQVIDTYNEDEEGGWSGQFHLPMDLTSISGVNSIDGPTVIALAQNVDLRTKNPVDYHSVAGTKIELSRMIVAYMRSGIKYYCYEDIAPDGVTIVDTFTRIEDAASAGYAADVTYLQNR